MEQQKRTSIELVREFHEIMGHPVEKAPTLPIPSLNELRFKLVIDETTEGYKATKQMDLVELADALGDMQYVIDGWFLCAGLQDYKDAIIEEIHASNLSKTCETVEEVEKSISVLSSNLPDLNWYEAPFTYKQVGGRYVIVNAMGKVMKPIGYRKPDIKKVLQLKIF